MGKSAIMSVRITGNSDDAVKALSKVTAKASAFGTFMGGAALKGVSAFGTRSRASPARSWTCPIPRTSSKTP